MGGGPSVSRDQALPGDIAREIRFRADGFQDERQRHLTRKRRPRHEWASLGFTGVSMQVEYDLWATIHGVGLCSSGLFKRV